MTYRHFVQVRRRSVKVWSEELDTFTVRGYGFRAECDCGAKSPTKVTWREARQWARSHRANHPGDVVLAIPLKPEA